MGTFVVTAPDGKEYEVTAPEGATEAQVLEYVKQNYAKTERTPMQEIGRQVGLTGRAAVTAAAGIPALFAEPVAAITNQLAGRKVFESPSKALQDILTRLGVPEPETGLERAVQTGTAAMAGVAPQVAAAKAVPALRGLAENVPAQIATAAPAGMAAQVASEQTMEATESPVAAAVAGMVGGVVAGKATGQAGQAAKAPFRPKVTLDEIKQRAQANYTKMEEQGVALKPLSVSKMLDNAEQELYAANFNPKLDTHKPVQQVLDDLKEMVGTQRVSFTKLEQMRSKATELRSSKEPATRRLAGKLVAEIDNYISTVNNRDVIAVKGSLNEAVNSVKQARSDWRNLAKASILEDALDVAEARTLDPKASEGELIRRQLINLAANKNKMRNFTEREQNAIKSVAKGGATDPILSLIARFNPERSQLVQAGTIFGATQNPAAAAAVAGTGFAADKLQSVLRQQAAKRLVSDVAGGNLLPEGLDYRVPGLMSSIYTQQ